MSPTTTLITYCLALVLASLAGGWLPMLVRLTHRRMEMLLSFISGVMLGVSLLLLLPHAFAARIEARPPASEDAHALAHEVLGPLMLALLAGFLVMFFIERYFCFHHHDPPPEVKGSKEVDHHHADAGHTCTHGHAHSDGHGHAHDSAHALTWGGAAIGLTLHSLLDGVAIAAAIAAAHHGESAWLAGFGAFLVVVLHKPFDALTLTTLMTAGRHSPGTRHLVNLAFALLTPIGAGLFMLGLAGSGESQAMILSTALAFAAGTFLCIALSDVLPELQFHQHDRFKLSLALVLGLALAWGVAELETRLHVHEHDHEHEHEHEHEVAPAGTSHDGHRH